MTYRNETIIKSWTNSQTLNNVNLTTDGSKLYSYHELIGYTLSNGAKVVINKTAPSGCFLSVTTSRHVNMCKPHVDAVECPVTGSVEIIPW